MKMKRKKILAILGSMSHRSSNRGILSYIAEAFRDMLDVEVYDSIANLPHFNPDLDNSDLLSVVREFRNRIAASDGVLICTPEYVFSIPGSLKNAIEWNVSTTVFSNKPVAIIVAAGLGERAFESLSLIMTTIESRLDEGSKLLIKGVKSKVGADGDIRDEVTLEKIDGVIRSLLLSIDSQDGRPTKYRTL